MAMKRPADLLAVALDYGGRAHLNVAEVAYHFDFVREGLFS